MAAIIAVIFGIIEFLVGLRLAFRFLGANPSTVFVDWVYDWSNPLVAPFAGIFGAPVTNPVGTVAPSVFEPSTLVALVVYAVIGAIMLKFFGGWRPAS